MPTFDLVVVGCGGGPIETNLSAYLFKPTDSSWDDGIIALEAGSGQGALRHILSKNPNLFATREYSASEIYSFVRCFVITHAHLDHINSLVLSAGSLGGPRKRIWAALQTLRDLETIFADRIWPNLASWDEDDEDHKLLYSTLQANKKYNTIYPNVSIRLIPINHGRNESSGAYDSSAFFIRHDPTSQEFLFFGDVEPDSIAPKPRTIDVWRIAASKIPETLSVIFIECSWPSGRPDDILFGHLSPEHLAEELEALAGQVVRFRNSPTSQRPVRKKQKKAAVSSAIPAEDLRGALDGLRVYVIHCKDGSDADDTPLREVIVAQVRTLVEAKGLGAEILAAEQGMRIEI